jgi:PIN domain nuclease of toxin-antitoxin system
VPDTHAFIHMATAPRRLGKRARAALESIESGRADGYLPAAAVAEVLLLRGLGRAEVGIPELRHMLEHNPHLRFHPLDLAQLDEFAALASIRDPFDRLLASAARSLGAHLISRDTWLTESGLVTTVWS